MQPRLILPTAYQLELEGLIAAAAATATPPSQPAPDGTSGRTLPLTVDQASVWRRRVMSTLANVFVMRGNWRLALDLLETMGEETEGNAASVGRGNGTGSTCRVELLSRIGRVFLQFGALKDAEIYFRCAEEVVTAEAEARDRGHVGDNARVGLKQCEELCKWLNFWEQWVRTPEKVVRLCVTLPVC